MSALQTDAVDPYPIGPDDLPPPPRRAVFSRKCNWWRGALLAALLVIPNVILLWGIDQGDDLRRLEADGRPVLGNVTDKWSRRRGRSGTAYRVRYTFAIDGRTYRDEAEVNWAMYRRFTAGRACTVTYQPGRPANHCLGRPQDHLRRQADGTLVAVGLLALSLAVGVVCLECSARWERRLARLGVAVVGRVTEQQALRTKNGMVYNVRYHFVPPGDVGRSGWTRVPFAHYQYLLPGTPVTVLFDPDRPGRNWPLYAFRHVRFLTETEAAESYAVDQS